MAVKSCRGNYEWLPTVFFFPLNLSWHVNVMRPHAQQVLENVLDTLIPVTVKGLFHDYFFCI